jgi:hypothetical protein
MADSTPAGTVVWRWFTGHPLDGKFRTDATWLRPSTKTLHPIPVVRWHHMPRLHRAGIRTAATLIALWVMVGLLAYRTAMLWVLFAVGMTGGAVGGWWGYYRARDWRHTRDWVKPLNVALPPGVTVAELTRDRTRAVLALPAGFTGDDKDKKLIMQAALAKLNPAAELKGAWALHGKNPQVTITLIQPPPGYVGFPAIQPYAEAAEEHQIVLGLGSPTAEYPGGAPVIISVDNDSPHLGYSMSSGDGKSVAVRNATCQLAHHGALIACIDPKLMSQHWCAGLRNVAYARTPAEIHALAIWLAAEVDRRNRFVLEHADVEGKVHGSTGPRIVAPLEEMNITQSILAAYWKSIDGKGKSPAVIALDFVSFSGRAVNVHLLYIGQRLSAKATSAGSGDARENIGVLLMSNPAASTWKMLVGDRHALPAATDVTGRQQVVTAKTVTEVQGAYATGAQARAYATSGIVAQPRSDMPCVGGLAPVGTPERAAQGVPDLAIEAGHGPGQGNVGETPGFVPASPMPTPPPITGPEAVAQGVLTGFNSWDSAHKALMRDPAGPRPGTGKRGNAPLWDPVELADWNEQRRGLGRLVRR